VKWATPFATKYSEKRAETLATKADFDEILRQLQKSTETAEGIKTTLAHKDWSEKEYKTLRRVKLEEFLSAVHEVEHWQGDASSIVQGTGQSGASVRPLLYRAKLLMTLYFPEFQGEFRNLHLKCAQIGSWSVDIMATLGSLTPGSQRYNEVFAANTGVYQQHVAELRNIVKGIEDKAEKIMTALIMA
jgi:dsDNA-specific endonuclease/ATPase MutS2